MNSFWYKDFENLTFTFHNVDRSNLVQYQLEPVQFLNAYKVSAIEI